MNYTGTRRAVWAAAAIVLSAVACPEPPPPAAAEPVDYSYRVVNVYPHDTGAFTQGLAYSGGFLFEGTGLRGRSSLRRVTLETGQVVQARALDRQFFGEGIAVVDGRIVQLTWTSGVGFVYDRSTFSLLETFAYDTEGWGLTHDGTHYIMSDGTPVLRWLDPETFDVTRTVTVADGGRPVSRLNELEYIDGTIYANVWQTDRVVIIAPDTGRVVGRIDLSGLLTAAERRLADVLNGIAYDPDGDRLFVTGKLWPKLFEIDLVEE